MAYNILVQGGYPRWVFRMSGFSTTILQSFALASVKGLDWDGTYLYCAYSYGATDKIIRYNGFSSSINSSVNAPSSSPNGVAWTSNNILSSDRMNQTLYQHNGFSSSLLDYIAAPGAIPAGIDAADTNTLSVDSNVSSPKHFRHYLFSTSIIDSYTTPGPFPTGISWHGNNVISADMENDLVYEHIGFSSSIAGSFLYPGSRDYNGPAGVCTEPTGPPVNPDPFEGALTFAGALFGKKTRYATLEGTLTFVGDAGNTYPWNPGKPWDPGDPGYDPSDPDKPQSKGGTTWYRYPLGTMSFYGLFGSDETGFKKELEGTLRLYGVLGTRRSDYTPSPPPPDWPPDPPHPPESGITFRRSRRGYLSFVGELDSEQQWPRGKFDKGTITDTFTITDTPISGGPSGRIALSREHPHRGKYYLAVHNPKKLFWGEVDSVTPDVDGTEIKYINSGGDRTACYHGITVKVYTSAGVYKGKVRLRPGMDDTTLPVAEQDDLDWAVGDLFEIYDVFELWSKFPRVIVDPGDPEALIWYRDWDITPADAAMPMQTAHTRCVPIIGPPTCAFLEDGTASVYFTAKDSYNINPLTPPAWWYWRFWDNSVLGWDSSVLETPGYFTWDAPGVYRVDCQVETGIPTWLMYPAFRYIHIFERTGENAPYTNFKVENLSGSVAEGGWVAEFEVYTDSPIADFPEGAQVILFAEEELGGFDFGSEEPLDYRSEVKYVGYIVAGSVSKEPGSRVVRFQTAGLQRLMKNRDNFSLALDYADITTADTWVKQDVLSPNYAFMNLLLWNSTLMSITDVFLPAYYYDTWPSISHKISEHLVKYQDFPRGTLWSQINALAKDVFAHIIVDRFGRVSIANDPQYTIEADMWADLPVPYTFGAEDWKAPLTLEFVDEPTTSVVCVEGVAYDGATATPVIGYYPGELPTYRGRVETRSGCVLASQDEAEFLAQRLFSKRNNTYPAVTFQCLGNYSFLDLVDFGGVQLSLEAASTRYGLAWEDKRFFVTGIHHEVDFETGLLSTELQLEAFATLRRPDKGT